MTRGRWIALLVAATFTVFAGRWAKGQFTTAEFVHFSVNFPVTPGLATTPLETIGGPWTMLEPGEFDGIPAGGVLVWGRQGRVVVDLAERSFIKEWVQPGTLLLSTHWLRNVGTIERRIRLDMELCGAGLQWVTFERDWDLASRSSTRAIPPGSTFNMDWIVTLTPEQLGGGRCDGALTVYDADRDELLTRLPIHLTWGGLGGGS
jgi:hypothetical protein